MYNYRFFINDASDCGLRCLLPSICTNMHTNNPLTPYLVESLNTIVLKICQYYHSLLKYIDTLLIVLWVFPFGLIVVTRFGALIRRSVIKFDDGSMVIWDV